MYLEPSLKNRSLGLLTALYESERRRENNEPYTGPRLIDDRQEHFDWLLKKRYVLEETSGGYVQLTEAGRTAAQARLK